ncbi:MAG: flavodoxin family protein [Clostridiales bacterium]|nr:flavodoxin family protein [Clostridiales bacterium]
MKITIIHGQNHKGSTYHIGKIFLTKYMETAGPGITGEGENGGTAEVNEFFLPRDLPHFCLGCFSCIEDDTKCAYFEEKTRIMKEVETSDLLIFTTPTYCMHASAPMKAFIDLTFNYWMAHRPRKCMFSKKAVVISTAAGAGTKSAIKDITTTLLYWGVPYIRTYGIAVQAASWDQVKDKKKKKIETDMAKLSASVRKAKVRTGIKTRGVFFLMRMMQKHDMGSSPVEKAYWEKQGWLGKGRPWK